MISVGDKFGRLTVKSKGESKNGQCRWFCVCECGNETLSYYGNLKKGVSTSCGCFRKEQIAKSLTTHGDAGQNKRSPTYRSWESMIRRVSSEKYKGYHRYGGRGITVCDRWRESYQSFLEDMGERPLDRTLDRINSDGNYEKENCRWADALTQSQNRLKSFRK